MRILDRGDPVDAYELMDREQAQREARLPKCECCGRPIVTETYLDLDGVLYCERCVKRNTHDSTELEE